MYAVVEEARRTAVAAINRRPKERDEIEKIHGQAWDTDQLGTDYEVLCFASPLVIVKRKSDGKVGSLFFQHYPRYYWGFEVAP